MSKIRSAFTKVSSTTFILQCARSFLVRFIKSKSDVARKSCESRRRKPNKIDQKPPTVQIKAISGLKAPGAIRQTSINKTGGGVG
ncbi:hypothetical protein CDAR_641 [Caerostris darwini]|uniref:Ribosomal protein S12 n=1 Tax=Caerostris darwini TaxID=1538125 RepID=A0AAV4UCF1_9ARAC|nr:hypothetical protein CDAR_641 [Caerostris darwini]